MHETKINVTGIMDVAEYCYGNMKDYGIRKTKYGHEYVCAEKHGTIYLFDDTYLIGRHKSMLHYSLIDSGTRIRIDDVLVDHVNAGLGSLMMEVLLGIAKCHGVKQIVGRLGNQDVADHGERLTHFYEKFGFNIEHDVIRLDMNRL